MSDELILAPLLQGEEDNLFNFYREMHDSGGDLEVAFYSWRKSESIHPFKNMPVVAKIGSRILGTVNVVPINLFYDGNKLTASWQQNSIVSPASRGKGVGKKLVNVAAKNWDLVLAKGTSKPMYGLRKSLGFSDVPHSDYLLRVNNVRENLKDVKAKLVEYVLRFWKICLPTPQVDLAIKVTDIDSFDQSFDKLADEFSKEKTVRPYKGQNYLNWRYFQCPGREYKVFRAGDQKTRGAIVVNKASLDSHEGWIVDMICSSADKACAYALIQAALKYFEKRNVERVWVFSTWGPARKWLCRFGFLPTGRTPRFTFRLRNTKMRSLELSQQSWDFWHGDGDIELYQ